MSTRHREEGAPLSQARYMSSTDFAELHGINGVAVSARTAILLDPKKRDFIWWLQALSLADGGLKRLARQLVEMFPERLGTREMHAAGMKPGKICPIELANNILRSLSPNPCFPSTAKQPCDGAILIDRCRQAALCGVDGPYGRDRKKKLPSLDEFLADFCINPRLSFSLPGQAEEDAKVDSFLAMENDPDLKSSEFRPATVPYFNDLIGALCMYKMQQEEERRSNFQLTTIARKIWEALDYGLRCQGMVCLNGLEGRGKTEAAKAWCDLHPGAARFVSLKGITTKTTAFREIAKALGIASSYTRTATEMQARIEDVLKRSKIFLVIDEAHFLFSQAHRIYTRPELVDWIDTALCNNGVGCALVTTPQFMTCLTRAAEQVGWNFRQFRRRVKRWVTLPPSNTQEDFRAVANAVFKNASAAVISKVVGYVLLSQRDVSAIGDLAAEIRALNGSQDLSHVSAQQVHRVAFEILMPSDAAFKEEMEGARTKKKNRAAMLPPSPSFPLPKSQIENETTLPARRSLANLDPDATLHTAPVGN